ncbi:hypothetical protein RDABS01_000062 [Bienertia sinuspersici]
MFKKAVEAKSLQRLSGADKKKLRRTVKEKFPRASDADVDALLPPKVTLQLTASFTFFNHLLLLISAELIAVKGFDSGTHYALRL